MRWWQRERFDCKKCKKKLEKNKKISKKYIDKKNGS